MASTRAPLARFETDSGARIYRIPVETFPGHVNNIYLILDRRHGGTSTLVDGHNLALLKGFGYDELRMSGRGPARACLPCRPG